MSWNHRILAHEYNGEVYLQIHEVYYNEDGYPNSYTENPVSVGGDDVESITWTLTKMLQCVGKPILWAGDKFPNKCKIKYTCKLCGKDTFNRRSPHKCKNGFRKRGFQWLIKFE